MNKWRSALTFSFVFALFFSAPGSLFAASLQFSPASASSNTGASVTGRVLVSTDQAINAVSVTLSFPADLLEVVSVSKANSILRLWVQEPTFSNAEGTITWSGIIPNPGYTGNNGEVLTVQFRAKRAGTATATFSSSAVLANDGNGTNVLTSTRPGTVIIAQSQVTPTPAPSGPPPSRSERGFLPRITSATHPNEEEWYREENASVAWNTSNKNAAVRIGYDKEIDGVPRVVYDPQITQKDLELEEGVWYFHVQERAQNGWGPISTFRIRIDVTPPALLVLDFPEGKSTSRATLPVRFKTDDALSGIEYYTVSIDGKEKKVSAEEANGSYVLAPDTNGIHDLKVVAYDRAGNTVEAADRFEVTGIPTEKEKGWSAFLEALRAWASSGNIPLLLLGATLLFPVLAWFVGQRGFPARAGRKDHPRLLIHEQFDALKEAVSEEILALEHARTKRELSAEEDRFMKKFKRMLDKAEHTIEKEIDAIAQPK